MDRLRPPAKPTHPFEPLSAREMEVLKMAAKGMSNKDIAEALELNLQTVKNYVSGTLTKLGAKSRAHAVAIALSRGETGSSEKEGVASYQAGLLTCFCGGNHWLVPSPGCLKCVNCGQVIMLPVTEKVQTISEEQISQFTGSGPKGIYEALMEEREQERQLERQRERSLGVPNENNKT